MRKPSRSVEWIVWGLVGLTVLAIVVAFLRERLSAPPRPPVLFSVRPFTLTNQAGQAFSTTELRGKVWIADIIFTSCAGPCPRMTSAMAQLSAGLGPDSPVRFVTLTTDPDHDSPEVLARYGKRYGADPARWLFLTGTKAQIRDAAVDCLKLTSLEKDPALRESASDLFIHSTIFLAVDKQGNVRGTFEMEEPGSLEKLQATLKALVQER